MKDKILDYLQGKNDATAAIWIGLTVVASLPFYHLVMLGVVLLLCIILQGK